MAPSIVSHGRVRNRPTGTLNLGSYATGGVAVSASLFGHPTALSGLKVEPTAGFVFEYVPATGKVKAYTPYPYAVNQHSQAEVTNGTDLSAVNAPFRSVGY